jgi:hypothetical protein
MKSVMSSARPQTPLSLSRGRLLSPESRDPMAYAGHRLMRGRPHVLPHHRRLSQNSQAAALLAPFPVNATPHLSERDGGGGNDGQVMAGQLERCRWNYRARRSRHEH